MRVFPVAMLKRFSSLLICFVMVWLPLQSFAMSLTCLHPNVDDAGVQTQMLCDEMDHADAHVQADATQEHQHQSAIKNNTCKAMCAIGCTSCASVALVSQYAKPTTPDVSALAIVAEAMIYASIHLKNPQRPPIFFS